MRTVKDPDIALGWNGLVDAPQIIARQLLGGRRLERSHVAALRIHSRHDVPDGPVFTRRVQPLQDDQQRIPFVGVQQMLQLTQPVKRFLVRFVVALFAERIVRIPVLETKLAARVTMQCLARSISYSIAYRRRSP